MKIFIGSSTKYLDVAKKVALIIEEKGHQPQLWKNCFIASEYTFEKLRNICESVDAGIFILAPDDQLSAEGNNEFITRDNVLIEAGMFMGKLGNPYTALCTFPEVKIPSDFLGITSIPYSAHNIFMFQEKTINWIEKVEQAIAIKNNTVFLQDKFPDFREVVLSARKEIMMSSFFMSIAQVSKELNGLIIRMCGVKN
jgi:predicted nucleotide-binding protein